MISDSSGAAENLNPPAVTCEPLEKACPFSLLSLRKRWWVWFGRTASSVLGQKGCSARTLPLEICTPVKHRRGGSGHSPSSRTQKRCLFPAQWFYSRFRAAVSDGQTKKSIRHGESDETMALMDSWSRGGSVIQMVASLTTCRIRSSDSSKPKRSEQASTTQSTVGTISNCSAGGWYLERMFELLLWQIEPKV